jgi:hypothetical protein
MPVSPVTIRLIKSLIICSPSASRPSFAVLFLLLISLPLTTSCGLPAKSQSFQSTSFAGSSSGRLRQFEFADHDSSKHITICANLPEATMGRPYNAVISVRGGAAPYQFSIVSGTLPSGLSLNSTTGTISGTPLVSGTYKFAIIATDAAGTSSREKGFTLAVADATVPTSISVSPASATVHSGGTQQFTAVTNNNNLSVTWSASAGSISNTGLFTAPVVSAQSTTIVTATIVAHPTKTASATVTVNASTPALLITSNTLPLAIAGAPYSTTLRASGGKLPYTWSIASGALPPGLQLDSKSAAISGTPAEVGAFSFTAKVTGADLHNTTHGLTLSVNPTSNSSGFDGPAELPRVYLRSTMADTPTPGNLINVTAGGNVQAALDSANCGDTVLLQAGATFTGSFTLPAKACDDQHWIVIRTSAPDSSLPPEGARMTPCYAGIASLPGRPAFQCLTTQTLLPRIAYNGTNGSGPLTFAWGANHYRLLGLEITRLAGTGYIGDLVSVKSGGTADKIVIDRVWLHGTAHDETGRGVGLNNTTNVSVVDSYLNDFHCTSVTGSCIDSQAVQGGSGIDPGGPYKIVDNFLEAAAEGVLFGGGPAAGTPADIEIRRNHFFKPLQWMPGTPGFVGGTDGRPFIVKNNFELKNAQRVLFEGNILEHSWGGFSQAGYSILLTPKNQTWGTTNVCPICQVTDVTIRYSIVRHAGAGIQIANVFSDAGGMALAGARYSIHDITLDDIRAKTYNGSGPLVLVLSNWTANPLNSVTINHITGINDPSRPMLTLGNQLSNPAMWGLNFTNNIVIAGSIPVWSAGGGSTACGYYDVPIVSLNACFSTYTFTDNALVADPLTYPPSKWPSGNYFPADINAVQFVNYNNGNGGDYHLQASSPYKNAGADGKDLGADIDMIETATAGVY